jgi:hypothetical protein
MSKAYDRIAKKTPLATRLEVLEDMAKIDKLEIERLKKELEKVKNLGLGGVGKRIFLVFEHRENIDRDREILKAFNKESEAVLWIANKNPKKYYYEMHKIG